MKAVFPGKRDTPPYSIRIVDWKGQKDDCWNVFVVKRERLSEEHHGEPEMWIIPAGACFLMSDSGKTIDRI